MKINRGESVNEKLRNENLWRNTGEKKMEEKAQVLI